jgi:hypothetical protein
MAVVIFTLQGFVVMSVVLVRMMVDVILVVTW